LSRQHSSAAVLVVDTEAPAADGGDALSAPHWRGRPLTMQVGKGCDCTARLMLEADWCWPSNMARGLQP
jgi:hypothetical protein